LGFRPRYGLSLASLQTHPLTAHMHLAFRVTHGTLEAMKLKKVEEWTRGKPQCPALASAFLITITGQIYGGMKLFTHGRRDEDEVYGSAEWIACHRLYTSLFQIRDINAWSRLYGKLDEEVPSFEVMGRFTDTPIVHALSDILEAFKHLKSPNDLNHPPFTDFIRIHLLNDFNAIEDESSPEERLRDLAPLFQIPFMTFLFKVFIPSLVYYRLSPLLLMRKAVAGDLDSLGDLLALDRNLLSMPEVHAVWEPVNRNAESADSKRGRTAMDRSPHRGLKPARVKTVIAAAIEGLFKVARQPIARNEIRDLFDRYVQDIGEGPIDADLPESENGFDEAIRREIAAWKAAAEVCE